MLVDITVKKKTLKLPTSISYALIGMIVVLIASVLPIIMRLNKFLSFDFPLYEGPDALAAISPGYAFAFVYLPTLLLDIYMIIRKKRRIKKWDFITPFIVGSIMYLNFTFIYH